MRLIHPTALRVGQMGRWNSDHLNLNQSLGLSGDTIQTILQSYLGSLFNMFVVKCDLRDNISTNSFDVSVVFYKYIQRARLVKSRRMALLIAAGLFKTKPPLYYVRLAQGFVIPMPVIIHLESLLYETFNVPVRLHFYNMTELQNYNFTKLDATTLKSIENFKHHQRERLAQTANARSWPPLESLVERRRLNPLQIRDMNPRLKSHANLVYSLDVFMAILYASQYNLSNLLADVIVRCLLRNMKRHKQVLALVETTIEYVRSFHNWPFKPTDRCIAVHGKIGGGSIRSRSYYIKTGFLPVQTITLAVDYTYRVAETKFGAIGVKVWMRKQT
jgi:hypothetical protein